MAAPKTTTAFYKQMLEAFRKTPGDFKAVAAACNTSVVTARLLWHKGWKNHDWARPLKDVVPEERTAFVQRMLRGKDQNPATAAEDAFIAQDALLLAEEREKLEAAIAEAKAEQERAAQERVKVAAELDAAKLALATAQEEAAKTVAEAKQFALDEVKRGEARANTRMAEIMEAGKLDAAETMADEAQGSKMLRRVAMQANVTALSQFKHAKALSDMLDRKIAANPDMSIRQIAGLHLLQVRIGAWAARTWDTYMRTERLRTGSPTEIVSVRAEDVPLREQERMARALLAAVARKKQLTNGQTTEETVPQPSADLPDMPPEGSNGVIH